MALAVVVALVVQVAVLSPMRGFAPDLVLLVVVAAALTAGHAGPGTGAVVGFIAGLLVDLAPPAEHLAGRSALALLVAGYLVGRLSPTTGRLGGITGRVGGITGRLGVVAAASFVAHSVFALTGLVYGQAHPTVATMLVVIAVGVVVDSAVGWFVVPALVRLFTREADDSDEPSGLIAPRVRDR